MAKTIAIISHFAPSLIGFRGPLIRDLVATGAKVYALAPDFDDNCGSRFEIRARSRSITL